MSEFRIEKDRIQEAIAEKNAAVARALEAMAQQAEGYAVALAPVDTGRLKNSITHALAGQSAKLDSYSDDHGKTYQYSGTAPEEPETVFIGTNVEYAPYVEYGTQRTLAQPFLKPAIERHIEEYKKIAETNLKGG